MAFRGLRNFVQEIRVTSSHDQEEEIVNTEKQKIRTYFSQGNRSSYDAQKYALKMLYMSILGYDVDFGLVPLSQLMASHDRQEKLTGYLVLQQIIKDFPDFLRLVTQTVLSDIQSNNQFAQCLALDFVANDGNAQMAEVLAGPILNLIQKDPEKIPAVVRKKALLSLIQLFRHNPDAATTAGAEPVLVHLLDQKNVGFLTCLIHLMYSLPEPSKFVAGKHRMIYLLVKIILRKEVTDDHVYYTVPCPWLVITLMRFLQKFPCELGEAPNPRTQVIENEAEMLTNVIQKCFEQVGKIGTTGLQSKINIHWALCLEAARLAAYFKDLLHTNFDLSFLFDVVRSTTVANNIKYAAFTCLSTLSPLDDVMLQIRANLNDVARAVVTNQDYAVRHRGLTLLYNAADAKSARAVAGALCYAVAQADAPSNYREDAALRAVQLCARYGDQQWVIQTLLRLIEHCVEIKQYDIWKQLANVVIRQAREDNFRDIYGAVLAKCVRSDLGRLTEDKLTLTVFCFTFCALNNFLEPKDYADAVPVIQQAAYLLQGRETAELYCLAANAVILCVGRGVIDPAVLQLLVRSEVVDVQQRACEAAALVNLGLKEKIVELYNFSE